MEFRCLRCGEHYPAKTQLWRCRCGGLFELAERPAFKPKAIRPTLNTLWRYREMIPLEGNSSPVSLGEGFTPLAEVELKGLRVWCKLEFLAPTGSFKDRGTSVLVSALKAWGIREVVEDSSGNAAASLAAYSAHAGIHCRLYVPAQASRAKLAQIQTYGAELVRIEGSREDAARAAQEATNRSYYASHVYNPLVLEGLKTFAYELWEQLSDMPEAVIFPSGHGTFLLGADMGFRDLQGAGLIKRRPRLIAVQSEQCAPLYTAFKSGAADVSPYPYGSGETIAEGIRIVCPPRAPQVLKAIRETGGEVLTVSDDEILQAQRLLALQGLYVEPTAAVALAGLLRWNVKPKGPIVVPLTGSGLKTWGSPA